MKILVDIHHPADVNFFKNVINELYDKNHQIIIVSLDRGELKKIVENDFPNINKLFIGKHINTIFSIIIQANIIRFFGIISLLSKENVDIGIGFGSFLLGGALKLFRKPNIQFDDDPESSMNLFLEKITATELFMPQFTSSNKNLKNMPGLKECPFKIYFTPSLLATSYKTE